MPTPNYRSGFGGSALIGATELSVMRWSANPSATILAFINSKTGPHPVRQATVTDFSCTIELDWSDSDQPFQSSLNLLPGTLVSNVSLLIDKTSNLGWLLSSMIVTSAPVSVDRGGGKTTTQIGLAVSGGTITPPAGTAY